MKTQIKKTSSNSTTDRATMEVAKKGGEFWAEIAHNREGGNWCILTGDGGNMDVKCVTEDVARATWKEWIAEFDGKIKTITYLKSTGLTIDEKEIKEQNEREDQQEKIDNTANKILDAELAKGRAFTESLCNWAVSKALEQVGSLPQSN